MTSCVFSPRSRKSGANELPLYLPNKVTMRTIQKFWASFRPLTSTLQESGIWLLAICPHSREPRRATQCKVLIYARRTPCHFARAILFHTFICALSTNKQCHRRQIQACFLSKLSERAIALLSSWVSDLELLCIRQSHETNSKPLRLGCDEVRDFGFAGQLEAKNRLLPLQTTGVRNALVPA